MPAGLSLFLCLYGSTWLTDDDSGFSRLGRSEIRYRVITNAGTAKGQTFEGAEGAAILLIIVFLHQGHTFGVSMEL